MSYIDNKINNNIDSQSLVYSATTAGATTSTSWQDITGSSITYTPPSNCKNVIYEAVLQLYYSPGLQNKSYYELYEDGSAMGLYYRSMEQSNRVKYNSLFKLKFLLPSYSGSKTYKIRVKAHSNLFQTKLTVDGDQRFSPIVTMYSII